MRQDWPGETRGATLRRLRETRGQSLTDLARIARLPKASIQDWETDRHAPSSAALDRLLDALDADARTHARLLAELGSSTARALLDHTPWGAPADLGQALRAMRLREGSVQSDVARTVGVRQGTLAKWEASDALPSDEALARLLAVLSASPEEIAALRCLMPTPGLDEPDVEARIARIVHEQPVALRDVLLIGLEAELWRRAVRDPLADATLARTMATRAQQALIRGAWKQIGPHVGRAARLSRIAREPDALAPGLYALNWMRQRTPGGAAEAARSLARWGGRMRDPVNRDWLASSQALALVRAGEERAGIEVLKRLWWEARDDAPWCYYGEDLVEALLLVGDPEGASRVLDALGERASEVATAKVAAAYGRASPEALARLRAQPDRIGRDEAVRIERLRVRVLRGGSPILV